MIDAPLLMLLEYKKHLSISFRDDMSVGTKNLRSCKEFVGCSMAWTT